MGTIIEPPFHGLSLRLLCTAIGPAGASTTLAGRVVNPTGGPVPGLYAVGSVAAPTSSGTGYNSGFSLSRALTFGFLAAEYVAHETTLGRR
jgi:3-oxosteroid 1-dehydrogenase